MIGSSTLLSTVFSMFISATMLLASCDGNSNTTSAEKVATDSIADTVATAVVPAEATEVISDSTNL